ncbi:MAG: class I SAM-dependent methyltransferase [Bacteroidota bacterium]
MRTRVGEGTGKPPTPPEAREVRRGPGKAFFAWLLSLGTGADARLYGDRKRELLGGLSGTVVEIGAGAGPNAPYLAPGTRWVAVEPNVHFHRHLRDAADARGLDLVLAAGVAERLPLADGEADAVVSTLVLCSVDGVEATLKEIRRVLKPGGRFVFIEHVAAPEASRLRTWQRRLRHPWGVIADGCRPDQDTLEAIERAGFASVDAERFRLRAGLVSPHIAGVAIR